MIPKELKTIMLCYIAAMATIKAGMLQIMLAPNGLGGLGTNTVFLLLVGGIAQMFGFCQLPKGEEKYSMV